MNPISRATRVPTPAFEARLGAELGRLMNVSATGALVRTSSPIATGYQCSLVLSASETSATFVVRVVRTLAVPVELTAAVSRLRQYHIGVKFTELSVPARQAVASLCGPALTELE